MDDPKREKSYKRETAAVMLMFLAGMIVWGVFRPSAALAAEGLMIPVFLFATAAFGFQAYATYVENR